MALAVVGAGPCGAAMALLLARRGHQVHLYEMRSDPAKPAGRSISLAISARGLATCERLGILEAVMHVSIPMRGRMINGQEWLYDHQLGRCIRSISRQDLLEIMLGKVIEHPNIQWLAERFDPDKVSLYEAVFACDGVNSACRDWLVQKDGLHAKVTYHDRKWVEHQATSPISI